MENYVTDIKVIEFKINGKKSLEIECEIKYNDLLWDKIEVKTSDPKLLKIINNNNFDAAILTLDYTGAIRKKIEIKGISVQKFNNTIGERVSFSCNLLPTEVLTYFYNTGHRNGLRVNYYINDSPMIAPRCRVVPNEDGEVKQIKGKKLTFSLSSGTSVESDVAFTYSSNGGHFESDRYQLLRINFANHDDDDVYKFIAEDINPQLDEALLITSLVHDGRISYYMWRAEYDNVMLCCYRSNTIKSEHITDNIHNQLIEHTEIEDFLKCTHSVFYESIYKEPISLSIYSLLVRKKSPLELAFLSYFQSLESLILTHKRLNQTELIMSDTEFAGLKRKLEKEIKDTIKDDSRKRAKVKEKLNELNRTSLKESATDFFNDFSIDIADIWPLFNNKSSGVTGLASIRNVIVHGDIIPREHLRSVAVASEHLRVMLIRVLFTLLGWEIDKTKVSPSYLQANHQLFNDYEKNASIKILNDHFSKNH